MKLFSDLFKSPGNTAWELARFLAAWAVLSFSGTFIATFVRGAQVMDFSAIGTGYGLVLAGAGALIWAKDTARTAALSQVKQDETAAVVASNPPAPSPIPQKVTVVNPASQPVPTTTADPEAEVDGP